MEQIDKIVKSKIAPKAKNILWDNGSDLMVYRNGKWEKVVKSLENRIVELENKLNEITITETN